MTKEQGNVILKAAIMEREKQDKHMYRNGPRGNTHLPFGEYRREDYVTSISDFNKAVKILLKNREDPLYLDVNDSSTRTHVILDV